VPPDSAGAAAAPDPAGAAASSGAVLAFIDVASGLGIPPRAGAIVVKPR